jgi:hypothetical protein
MANQAINLLMVPLKVMASSNYHYIYQLSHCNKQVFQKSSFEMLTVNQQGLIFGFTSMKVLIRKNN